MLILTCPQCRAKLKADPAIAGKAVRCSNCSTTFVAAAAEAEFAPVEPPRRQPDVGFATNPPPVPFDPEPPVTRPSRKRYDDDLDDDFDDDDYQRPRRRRRRRDEQNSGGHVCSILSCVFGGIAFLVCPPIFGIAGLVLGIIGVCLSRDKTLGSIGIVVSALGMIFGMALGIALTTGRWRAF
jgi:predicted Zn finger-like uncharacterized protein